MTKEEFYYLAKNHPKITSPSIYRLTVRVYDKETKGYRKCRNEDDYYFKCSTKHQFYSGKEEALNALMNHIKEVEQPYNYALHSALIDRIPIDSHLDMDGQLEWWFFDRNGNEIDYSVCAWESGEPLLRDVYFGRTPEEYRFKVGDIVEIVSGDRIYLSIICDVPGSIDEMWKCYKKVFDRRGPEPKGEYPGGWFHDAVFNDTYFYLTSDGFDPDTFPYYVTAPTFPVNKNVVEMLNNRLLNWNSKDN